MARTYNVSISSYAAHIKHKHNALVHIISRDGYVCHHHLRRSNAIRGIINSNKSISCALLYVMAFFIDDAFALHLFDNSYQHFNDVASSSFQAYSSSLNKQLNI